MKLNNKGWGLNTLLICIAIILTALIFCVYYVSKLYNELDEKLNPNPFAEEGVVLDSDSYYLDKVSLINDATNNYLVDNNITVLSGDVLLVNLNDLIEFYYIGNIYDYKTANRCEGYSLVTNNSDVYDINSFIKCDSYTSVGYGDY